MASYVIFTRFTFTSLLHTQSWVYYKCVKKQNHSPQHDSNPWPSSCHSNTLNWETNGKLQQRSRFLFWKLLLLFPCLLLFCKLVHVCTSKRLHLSGTLASINLKVKSEAEYFVKIDFQLTTANSFKVAGFLYINNWLDIVEGRQLPIIIIMNVAKLSTQQFEEDEKITYVPCKTSIFKASLGQTPTVATHGTSKVSTVNACYQQHTIRLTKWSFALHRARANASKTNQGILPLKNHNCF